MRRAVLWLVLAVLAAGCGEATQVREPDVVVSGGSSPSGDVEAPPGPESTGGGSVRISVVTHGQASSAFWAIVRNGVDAAQRQMNVTVSYRSPDVYSLQRMASLINDAVDNRPDGLVVSIPSPALAAPVRRAVKAGIPVVSINSGSDVYRRLGVLAHVGQPEDRAGLTAGERFAAAGVRRGLCLKQEVGNAGLDRSCRAFASALRRAGGTSRVLEGDLQNPSLTRRRLAAAVAGGRADGVLTLNDSGAEAALAVVHDDAVRLGTFDLSPEVLEAVRSGRMDFAIDQQPYLQGYLPVVLLAERARYGLFPVQRGLIRTGPNVVTRKTAARVLRLNRRGIR